MSRNMTAFSLSLLVAFCLVTTGCGVAGTDGTGEPMAEGRVYLLSSEPVDAVGVVAFREQLAESSEPKEVVLVGRVGGLSQATWEPGRAAFMMSDLDLEANDAAADGAPPHDADNCPFCKARKKEEFASCALVQIVDDDGNTPSVSARKLLALKEGQTVVVQGTAALDSLGILTVRARRLFVRPEGSQSE